MIKKKLGVLFLTFAMGISAVACGNANTNANAGQEQSKDVDVVIGTANGYLCYAPLHVAIDNGYFEEEFSKAGITWRAEEVDVGQLVDLIATDKINASLALTGQVLPQIDNGLEIQFTGGVHTGCTKIYVKPDSGINSIADLKGKKIGVGGLGDSSVIALKRILTDEGVSVRIENPEVEWVVYGLTDLAIALDNGAVDAVALHDPVAYTAEAEYGFKKILDLATDEKFKDEYCCMSFVSTKLAQDNPEAAAAYTRAIFKASAFVAANPEEAAKIQLDNNHCSGSLEDNAAILGSYNYSPSVSLAYQTIHNASSELISINEMRATDADEFTNNAFIKLDGVPETYTYENGTFK